MSARKTKRRIIPRRRGEIQLAVQSALSKLTLSTVPKEVSDKIQEFLGVLGPEYLADVEAHQASRANVNSARDAQHDKNDEADEAVMDFLAAAKLNGGDALLAELLRELGGLAPSAVLRQTDREQLISIAAFITRVDARGLKVPGDRFALVKSTQEALQASVFTTDAAVEAQAAASAKVDASEAKVLAAYRAMVAVLKLVVGEEAVYEHLLTFEPTARAAEPAAEPRTEQSAADNDDDGTA